MAPLSRSKFKVLVFGEGGKPENSQKNPRSKEQGANQQKTQPTYGTGPESKGKRSHHCAILAPRNFFILCNPDITRFQIPVTDLGEGTGIPVPLILNKSQKEEKPAGQAKQNRHTPPPHPRPSRLSSKSGSASGYCVSNHRKSSN